MKGLGLKECGPSRLPKHDSRDIRQGKRQAALRSGLTGSSLDIWSSAGEQSHPSVTLEPLLISSEDTMNLHSRSLTLEENLPFRQEFPLLPPPVQEFDLIDPFLPSENWELPDLSWSAELVEQIITNINKTCGGLEDEYNFEA